MTKKILRSIRKGLRISKKKNHAPSAVSRPTPDMSNSDLRMLLHASYDGKLADRGGYTVDRNLSDHLAQVYTHPTHGPVVVHRGTNSSEDWATDYLMARHGVRTKRFDHGRRIQESAIAKHGPVTSIGHSLGGKIAEEVSDRSTPVITYNKPTIPEDVVRRRKVKENQRDIRTSGDAVSVLRSLQPGRSAEVIDTSNKRWNPLTAHSTDRLG